MWGGLWRERQRGLGGGGRMLLYLGLTAVAAAKVGAWPHPTPRPHPTPPLPTPAYQPLPASRPGGLPGGGPHEAAAGQGGGTGGDCDGGREGRRVRRHCCLRWGRGERGQGMAGWIGGGGRAMGKAAGCSSTCWQLVGGSTQESDSRRPNDPRAGPCTRLPDLSDSTSPPM